MRILGVIDLMAGRAVHARGGRREYYLPVRSVAGTPITGGDPLAVARAYLKLGITEFYVADLDAITSAVPPAVTISALAGMAPLWLDAGISSANAARRALAAGATRVVIGLETLTAVNALAAICDTIGSEHVAFSLDLQNGVPLARPGVADSMSPETIAAVAVAAGATAILVLDLARVGAAGGPDADVIRRIHDAVPQALLLAGGGISGPGDLAAVASAGCEGVLVASALHDGRLTAADVDAARRRHPYVSR